MALARAELARWAGQAEEVRRQLDVAATAALVTALAFTPVARAADAPSYPQGAAAFQTNCAVCHGDAGQGDREKGAPRLASHVHLYGNDRATVVGQITSPRMGVMPAWHTRLDEATIKSLALYVHSLGGGE